MKIALALGPDASAVSTFGTQCGVEHAVGTFGLEPLPDKPIADEAQPFSRQSLARFKAQYEKNGYQLSVIESRPPMEKIKLAQPGRDEEIAVVCEFIRNMGAVGIPVWCPAWMPTLFVIRTSSEIPTRGGAKVTGFDLEEFNKTHPAGEHGAVTEEDQWDNLKYFLERVVPVAEEANVKLAMHPDDPPLSPIQGIARIISSVENYQKMVDLVPSPANGIGLCQGNFGLMTDDLPSVIRHFGEQQKIHFVHFRDIRGTPEKFDEAFHDDGKHDMAACVRAYRDTGYEGVARPDHFPQLTYEDFVDVHSMERLYAIGYMRGLIEAVYSE